MTFLRLENLQVGYEKGKPILDGYNLSIGRGELVSLLGPSGCGKTTTLRAVAGFIEPEGGRVVIDGRDFARLPPHKRNIGLVFQNYALFPHLNVFDNVAFGLKMRRVNRAEIARRVPEALDSVGMTGFEKRLPAQLSGGQQQRVALARAIVIEPDVLLLDEPLSNLDAKLRIEMRAELRRLQKQLGITMLYVTHDQAEALSLSDRIVVMNHGQIEQEGPPEVIYHRPTTAFVARFMGFDNVFPATVKAVDGPRVELDTSAGAFQAELPEARPLSPGDRVDAFFRPNNARLEEAPGPNRLAGKHDFFTFQGSTTQYFIETALGRFNVILPEETPREDLDEVYLSIPPRSLILTPHTAD